MLALARTYALVAAEAVGVDAEVDIHRGLPAFTIVGLPDAAVRESRERVRAAVVNSGFEFPLKRVTVSLAPSDLRKAGPGYDLAIAAGLLAASGQLPSGLLERWTFAGELALDGALRPVRGALAMAEAAAAQGAGGIVVPLADAGEAALVDGLAVAPLASLATLRDLAEGVVAEPPSPTEPTPGAPFHGPDLSDLRGQPALRRALEIAATGSHSVFIAGPPGAGKSLAARRLPSLLPPLEPAAALEVRRIAGVAGLEPRGERPFRAPHHTISTAGLVGGGRPLRAGEVTLAHRGVLFLDELGEFARPALEALREPIESGEVTIARASGIARFPARFQLVAAANLCPCGHGEGSERCRCGPEQIRRYAARLSGALADRIDIQLSIRQPPAESLAGDRGESSAEVRARVLRAQALRRARDEARGGGAEEATVAAEELTRAGASAALSAGPEALTALAEGQRRLGLSGRGWVRALRLARTIADLEGVETIGGAHVAEALSLRGGPGGRG